MVSVVMVAALLSACTKNFKKYNTDTTGVTDAQLLPDFNSIGAFYPAMQQSLIPLNDPTTADIGEYLEAGNYSGYIGSGFVGVDHRTYNHLTAWDGYSLFNFYYNNTMASLNEVRRKKGRETAPDFWGVGLILKVGGLHKVTDTHGPIPYSQYGLGGTSVPYDSQQSVYELMFKELDTAVTNLQAYVTAHPGAAPFTKFDISNYKGDYHGWIRLANSLRLRLAMHIVKVDPATAKLQAEKALDPANGGVMTTNADNMVVTGGLNWLAGGAFIWGDFRAGQAIISFMKGYNDPRLTVLFAPSTILPGEIIGIRQGAQLSSQSVYNKFSSFNSTTFSTTTPGVFMTASEVFFLRAEGALRGWNMGGETAQAYYESGINTSFQQWGVSGAAAYIADGTSVPEDYTDPVLSVNSAPSLTHITIKWDDGASNEEKLERITTQKYLSGFPNGTEAWTNFRRTGYPKLLPVVVNNSGGTVNTDIQIRRQWYPSTEYNVNGVEVNKAVSTLLGGPDNGGTRLWWDVVGGNF